MSESPTARSGAAAASLYSLLAGGSGSVEKQARLFLVWFRHSPAEQKPWIMGHGVKQRYCVSFNVLTPSWIKTAI